MNARLWLVPFLLSLAGCGQPTAPDTDSALASLGDQNGTGPTIAEKRAAAQRFRDIFGTLAAGRLSAAEADSLVFMPNDRVFAATEASPSQGNPRAGLESGLRGILPSDLFREARAHPTHPVAGALAALRERPVTILSFPGIFVEFSASRPYEDILRREQSFAARRWRERLRNRRETALVHDETFRLETLSREQVPLAEVVNVASLDTTDGDPLVTLAYLRPLQGSLESLGRVEEHTDDYLRRADKFFRIWGVPRDVYLLGYSRGGFATLDFLQAARAHPEYAWWARHIRGVVSVGGVLNGSLFSDDFPNATSGLGAAMLSLTKLGQELEDAPDEAGFFKRTRIAWNNTKRWGRMALGLKEALTAPSEPNPALEAEHLKAGKPALGSSLELMRRFMFEHFNFLEFPGADYFENIARFKVLTREARESIDDMSTPAMQSWWRTHTLPTDVEYYSVLSTMWDTSESGVAPAMAANPLAYDAASLDFVMNRGSYYELEKKTGISLSDGAVTAVEGLFSNPLIRALNPRQAPLRAWPLAFLGSHHWATVMPAGIQTQGQHDSPFPRALFLATLGAFLSEKAVPAPSAAGSCD